VALEAEAVEPLPPGPAAGGGGAPSDVSALPAATPSPPAKASPDATALAVTAVLTTVINVLPISPRTIRLAMKGISAIMIDNNRLARLMTIIWLEPEKAFRKDPVNCMGSVICSADIRD
jgi:hypothetical protein